MAKLPSGLQFSLVELLALILVAGIGAAALKTGGVMLAVLLQSAIWLSAGAAVTAIFAKEVRRAFAAGFLIGVTFYVGPVLYVGESELDPYETQLPLTQPLLSLYAAMEAEAWVHEPTGERFSVWTTEVTRSTDLVAGNLSQLGGSYSQPHYTLPDGRVVTLSEEPPRFEFMLAAHALLTIASGYLFGKFATIVYRRRSSPRDGTSNEP
ncbi:MAG TPA: hypothetical protein VGN57_14680 [Pirellulaceae bacterium]|jgi:hypothetical protein|nr:hypothetical protein [Pirellulaceae bacterium]